MKRAVLLSLLLITLPALAHEPSSEDVPRIIKIELLVHPDITRADLSDWNELVQKVEDLKKSEENAKLLSELAELLAKSVTRGSSIHGELNVSFGNGRCIPSCGDSCSCLEKHHGVCPCGLQGQKCGCGCTRP